MTKTEHRAKKKKRRRLFIRQLEANGKSALMEALTPNGVAQGKRYKISKSPEFFPEDPWDSRGVGASETGRVPGCRMTRDGDTG